MRMYVDGIFQDFLFEYGLGPVDALIIRWITDFMNSGHQRAIKFVNKKTGKIEYYYWVSYTYVLQELPTLYLKSTRSIARKMKKYCDAGIFERQYKDTGNGYLSCFRFNEPMRSRMFKAKKTDTLKTEKVIP